MDSFMDKLAQRLNAQEIIKANVAAESTETAAQPPRGQNAEYDAVIQKLKDTADQYARGASALTESTARAEKAVAKTQELMEAGIDGIAENAVRTAESLNKLESVVTRAENSLGKLEDAVFKAGTSSVKEEQGFSKSEENAIRVEENLVKITENALKSEQVLSRMVENAVKTEDTLGRIEGGLGKTDQALSRIENASERAEQAIGRIGENAVKTEDVLGRMEENTTRTQQVLGKVTENAAKSEENMTKVEELLAEGIAKIEAMQVQGGSQNTEDLQALLSELKQVQAEQFEQLSDHVHKENVKVYRNVQAAVVEENGKQNDAIAKPVNALAGKLGAILGISAVALLASVAGLVFQILVYLNII